MPAVKVVPQFKTPTFNTVNSHAQASRRSCGTLREVTGTSLDIL